jgi:hypothetical protein
MNTFTPSDVEKLARGERVPPDVLLAILADPQASRELARQRRLVELIRGEDADGVPELPPLEVTFAEIDAYLSGKPQSAEVRAAVERTLRENPIEETQTRGDSPTSLEGDTELYSS